REVLGEACRRLGPRFWRSTLECRSRGHRVEWRNRQIESSGDEAREASETDEGLRHASWHADCPGRRQPSGTTTDTRRPTMKKSLSQREVEIYRQRLLRMRLATAAAVQSVEERSLQSTQGTRSEIGDGAAEETVMDLELEGLAIQRELDRSTERALDRVEEGLYGVCAT